tara:strand:+ start:1165 stop:1530 length:366 start_codon:yes stop_codon:yes gene_type:complete
MTFELKFKELDRFDHPKMSTHATADAQKTERKLRKMAKKLDVCSYNPIWISEEHGTAIVTLRNKNLNLIEGATYSMKLSARIVRGEHANVWADKVKLISKPDLGDLVSFDSDSDSDGEDCP